jgi:hypothetical protein
MSLRRIERRRCPHDRWFRTEANLNSILRSMTHHDDEEARWPKSLCETTVPIWVRMERYKAQETKRRPDGMTWGPVIKIGTLNSPEVPMFGYHHSCGLSYDYRLDGIDASEDGKWLYHPPEGEDGWGEDVSVYECSKCHEHLYRDDFGLREDKHSACLKDGEVVCRACDWHGMIAPAEVRARIDTCRRLADHVGPECLRKFDRDIEIMARKVSGGGRPLQTRLWLDGDWSFTWSTLAYDEGEWKRYMHGGLIMHGPRPLLNGDLTYSFEQYDYGDKEWRNATVEEVSRLEWCIHT